MFGVIFPKKMYANHAAPWSSSSNVRGSGSTMTKRYTVCEALDQIFDHDTGEEERGQETDSEVVCDK